MNETKTLTPPRMVVISLIISLVDDDTFSITVLNQCHLVKLIGSLWGKPLTKIYKL